MIESREVAQSLASEGRLRNFDEEPDALRRLLAFEGILPHVDRRDGGLWITVLEAIGALRLFAEREGNVDRLHGGLLSGEVQKGSIVERAFAFGVTIPAWKGLGMAG